MGAVKLEKQGTVWQRGQKHQLYIPSKQFVLQQLSLATRHIYTAESAITGPGTKISTEQCQYCISSSANWRQVYSQGRWVAWETWNCKQDGTENYTKVQTYMNIGAWEYCTLSQRRQLNRRNRSLVFCYGDRLGCCNYKERAALT